MNDFCRPPKRVLEIPIGYWTTLQETLLSQRPSVVCKAFWFDLTSPHPFSGHPEPEILFLPSWQMRQKEIAPFLCANGIFCRGWLLSSSSQADGFLVHKNVITHHGNEMDICSYL